MLIRRVVEHNKRFSESVGSLLGESSREDSDSVVLHLIFGAIRDSGSFG